MTTMIINKHGFAITRFVLVLLLASTGWSQSVRQRPDDAQFNPQTVNATTIVLLKMAPDQLQLPPWLDATDSVGPESSLTKARVAATRGLQWLKRVSAKDHFYVSVDIPYTKAQPVVRVMVPNRMPGNLDALKQQLAKVFGGNPMLVGDFVVTSPTQSLQEAAYALDEKILSAARPDFESAAEAVSEFPVQILIVPPGYLSDTFDELLPELPDPLGGGPTSVITHGMRWAAIGVEPIPTKISIKIQSDSPLAAEALANRLPALLKHLLAQTPEPYRATINPFSETLLRLMNTTVMEDQIHISFGSLDVSESPAETLISMLDNLTGPLTRAGKTDRMRSIVLGILNYESANGSMPPGKKTRDANGKSKLSWRVHILPYLDEMELYSQFHLDQSWDSPHNLKLLDQMPKVFNTYAGSILSGHEVKPGYTPLVAPVGEGTIFGGDQVTNIRDIRDGVSKTLAVVEVKPELAVPWTAPQDYDFDAKAPSRGLAWGADDATGVMFCDGHWHLLKKSISDETLLRLFQMNDGKTVRLE